MKELIGQIKYEPLKNLCNFYNHRYNKMIIGTWKDSHAMGDWHMRHLKFSKVLKS